MTGERMQQIVAAFAWAALDTHNRTATAKHEFGAEAPTLWIMILGNGRQVGLFVPEDAGIDFDALLDAEEEKHDKQELARLKEKLEGK